MLAVPSVLADHIPGATYTGQTSAGGSVSLTLTPDGNGIASFSVKQIRSQNCPNTTLSLEETSYQPAGLMPIQDHRFSKTSDGSTFEGAFPGAQRAEGTVRWSSSSGRDAGGRPCETGPLSWAAMTDAQAVTTPLAPFCEGAATPAFEGQLALLKARLAATMGEPAECAHLDASSGDTVQATTTGLAYVRTATSTPTFTDGAHRWALTPAGLVTWDGEALDPPADATAVADPSAAQPTAVVLAPPPSDPQSGPAVVVTPPAGARNTAPPQQPAAPQQPAVPQPTAVGLAPTPVPPPPAPTTASPWRARVLSAHATNQVRISGLGQTSASAQPGYTILLVDAELSYSGTEPNGMVSTLKAKLMLPSGAVQEADGLGPVGGAMNCMRCVSFQALSRGATGTYSFAYPIPVSALAGPLAFLFEDLPPIPFTVS
ncbi:MAG: hypothetical protein U0893_23005 [Chloroflexota bacterium]